MRKIFSFIVTSADGYYESTDKGTDWHNVNAEFGEFASAQLDAADTMVFGRVTYEGMAAFWPTPAAKEAVPEMAERMNGIAKLVASRTLASADWSGTTLVSDDIAGALSAQKQRPGKDIIVMGSANLTLNLMRAGVLDELRIMVFPIVLGEGRPMFGAPGDRVPLSLLEARPFTSGNVLLRYQPEVR
jgi:dihydrofolate reductase